MSFSILLADSGSTKTEWRLIRAGHPPLSVRTDGLNPYFQDEARLTQTIQDQLVPTLPTAITAVSVFFYGAGCTSPATETRMATAIRAAIPGVATVSVASDLLGAARSVAGTQLGVVCILGTGANACFFDGQQIITPSRSLGFWLGDEGSGGNLGKRLVTAYLHGLLPPHLHQRFAQTHPDVDRLRVLDHAYNQPYPNRYFAGFAPFLSAHKDDPFVRPFVETAFTDFLNLYVAPLRAPTNVPVHFVGSVAFIFSDWLTDLLIRHNWQPGLFSQAPMDGLAAYHSA